MNVAMEHHEEPEQPHDVLRFCNKLRNGEPPEPADAAFAVDRATTLAHELGNLIDGSLRSLNLARQSLDPIEAEPEDSDLSVVRKRLGVVYDSLERMGELVHGAMSSSAITSIGLGPRAISMAEAVEHAAEVNRPIADELKTTIVVSVESRLAETAAGPIYPVVLNSIRNAIESVARVGGGGRIQVDASIDEDERVVVSVIDDGIGMPEGDDADCIFMLGCTSKEDGLGLGLAICRDIAESLGGSVELLPRTDPVTAERPGVHFRLIFPLKSVTDNQ